MARRPLPRCTRPTCTARSTSYVKHSLLKSRRRTQRRYRCPACNKTFSANVGTPYHRMRHPAKLFDQVIALSTEGNTRAGVARALGLSPGTVARWIEKASAHAQAFNELKVQKVEPVELRSDELKVLAGNKSRPIWAYTAVEVWSRLWMTTLVGKRTLRNTLLHFRDMKERCRKAGPRVLISTDCFKYNEKVIARTFGPSCVYVQVKKRFLKGRVVRAEKRLVLGAEWHYDDAMERSEDSKTINTAYVERLNLTIRRSLACLQRKTNATCRSTESLAGQLELLRCYYNFIKPHSSLKFGRVVRTPAQQAGLVPNRLAWRKIFTSRLLDRQDLSFRSRMRARAVGQLHMGVS